jgi:hypothetical protein
MLVVVGDVETTWLTPADVLPAKSIEPVYVAVSVFVPSAVGVRSQLPTPKVRLATVQLAPVPSLISTLPVGVPAPGAFVATLIETVTASPTTEAVGVRDSIVVVVVAGATVWATCPTLPAKLSSVTYVAVT